MFGIIVKFNMAKRLWNAFRGDETVRKPLADGLKRTVLYYSGLVKKHTPVDTGRLRSSVTHTLGSNLGKVGTNVKYAQFVEYGTTKMEARHVSPSSSKRILGMGPFTRALELLQTWLGSGEHKIHTNIEKEFKA